MGLCRRTWRNRDGKVITSSPWWMDAMVDGRQVCRPTGVTNKKAAQKIYDAWRAEIAQGRFDLLKKAPKLMEWAEKYLKAVDHPNTRKRYESSKENLVSFFGEGAQLDHLSTARIEQFKQQRREEGVKGSTINRDLRFLAQILKQAERERCLARRPFDATKFFVNETGIDENPTSSVGRSRKNFWLWLRRDCEYSLSLAWKPECERVKCSSSSGRTSTS